MSMIDTFNRGIPATINKSNELYEVWFGQTEFTPEIEITQSSDINCGALCNELEFVRVVSQYHATSFDLDIAEGTNLEELIESLIDLPRNSAAEIDDTYRKRFRFIVNEQVNYRRTTRHAIKDAITYFVADEDSIQVVEFFDSSSHYFQIRLEGISTYEDVIFFNNPDQAYIDQNFIGGPSIGATITYLGGLIDRIKAAGVDYDIQFISQSFSAIDSDCIIGTVQMYIDAGGHIMRIESTTLDSDGEIV